MILISGADSKGIQDVQASNSVSMYFLAKVLGWIEKTMLCIYSSLVQNNSKLSVGTTDETTFPFFLAN
ncbi:unnamed protein product [Penicillium roqueforti FM164]|uniref:Genomic scaffold, ProqFM164S03 n=1 Tax=Penicillium roqueforti (strain FM164) TaxID=1365484 RepID=W6QBY9_PENRF|nr:unnamed protein product [Penicillium roqueforti FM164]